MKKELSFKEMRGIRFLAEIFKIIATYIHYAEKKNSGYSLSQEGIAKAMSIEESTLFLGRPYFFQKLGVRVSEDISPIALVDLDDVCVRIKNAKEKTDFSRIKKLCMDYHEKWYPY